MKEVVAVEDHVFASLGSDGYLLSLLLQGFQGILDSFQIANDFRLDRPLMFGNVEGL